MARDDRRIDLTIGATDEASEKLDEVAEKVEKLGDGEAEVTIEADTKEAESRLERFEREVEDLTGDARELRFEFRAQQTQREIRNLLRDLERLEDPVAIEATSRDLERAQKELRDLAELADRKYEIEIDADPRRTAQRAAGDIEAMRTRGEGLQSALPALRGFGDELGESARNAGIAGQAVGDLGDLALISAERFTVAGSRMRTVATRLGTALGAIGLLAALAGIAQSLGNTVLPRFYEWITGTEDAEKRTKALAEAVDDAAEAMAKGNYEAAIRALIENNGELIAGLEEAGIGMDDFLRFVLGQSDITELRDLYGDALDPFVGDLQRIRTAFQRGVIDEGQISGLIDELIEAEGVTEDAADATDDFTEAQRAAADEAERLARVQRDAAEAELDAADARRAAADATFGVLRAQTDFTEQLGTYIEVMGDAEATDADRQRVTLESIDAAARLADEQVRLAEETAAANGETLSQAESTALWNESMVDAAAQAEGPLRSSILDYIGAVNGIPPRKLSEIEALINEGKLDEAERKLNRASRKRRQEIEAEADVAEAEQDLNNAARDRESTVRARVVIDGVNYTGIDLGNGVIVPVSGGPAGGAGATTPEGVGLYTSPNPDPAFDPLAGTSVRRAGGRVAGATFVTVNLPPGADGRDVRRALDRWDRANGR